MKSVVLLNSENAALIRMRSDASPETVFVNLTTSQLIFRGRDARARVQVVRVALYILASGGRPVSIAELVDLLYGHRIDGGPDAADRVVARCISDARFATCAVGLCLRTHGISGYTIELAEAAAAA